MERFANFIIEKRKYILAGIVLMTLFFGYHASNMRVATIFNDLLPQNHEYIDVHNEVRDVFGGANQVLVMVQVRDPEKGGAYKDIFNPDTLARVKLITDELRKFQAVDRYKILSIASSQVRDMQMTSQGFISTPLMWPEVPQTDEELEDLRLMVYGNPMAYPGLVSLDSKSALIMVDFFEEHIDYAVCFNEFQELRKRTEDANHIVAIAGEPMHLGYIDSYVGDVVRILIYTLLAMMIVLFLYFRSKRGMLLPITAALVSAVWGLGFLSLLGYNLDPLVLVFPFLIAAMAASHATQVGKRYREEAFKYSDSKSVCKKVVQSLFKPGMGGILTDASGIIIIAITPIAILQKITLSCAFWAFATVIIAMILVPIILSYMSLQKPERIVRTPTKIISLLLVAAVVGIHFFYGIPHADWLMVTLFGLLVVLSCFLGAGSSEGSGLLDRLLVWTGRRLSGQCKYWVIAISVCLFIWGCTFLNKITIGNAVPGSEILWPFHRYNVDSFRISFAMPLLNPLYVILDTGKSQGAARAAATREVLRFERYMKNTPDRKVVLVQTLQGRIPGIHAGMRERDPRWRFLPVEDNQTELLFRTALQTGGPGSFDKFVDLGDRNINIVVFCRDKTAQTIQEVIGRVKHYIEHESTIKGTDMRYKLAGGAVGVQAAINETLTQYQLLTLGLAFLVVFVFCSVIFKSMVAGIIILAPLLLSNVLAFTFMVLNKPPLPLTTATLPVSAVGIGLGVNYGIYLISRIIEEFKSTGSLEQSIVNALGTTGKAIIYIATTLICGIVFWFLSMMMFQALMGLLLAIILTLNMLGALLVIPSCIMAFKPRFIVGHKP